MFGLEFYQLYIGALFVSIILVDVVDVPGKIKKLLKIKAHKRVAGLDCLPCFTFWTSLILTFNPFVAMATYLTAMIINSLRYK